MGSFFQYVLDIKLSSFVGGSDERPTGCVCKSQLLPHLLPKLELVWWNVFLDLDTQDSRRQIIIIIR